jgi:Fur family transcriptional regulator, peroxide stress response regulator
MSGKKKYSRKREAILKKIRGTTAHPTADWIYEEVKKEMPDISLGTVYRNLAVFKDEGLIISVGVVGGQERFDANTLEHTHFICLGCGEVLDIEVDVEESLNESVASKNGIDVFFRQLTFYGNCNKCHHKHKNI